MSPNHAASTSDHSSDRTVTVVRPVVNSFDGKTSQTSLSAESEPSSNPDIIPSNEPSTSVQRHHSDDQCSCNQNGFSDVDDAYGSNGELRFNSSQSFGLSNPISANRRVRRGAVSGEVYTEEDAASYVKKVSLY